MKKFFSFFIAALVISCVMYGFVFSDNHGKSSVGNYINGIHNNTQYYDSPYPPIYTDNCDGANDTTSLKARGYKVYKNTNVSATNPIWYTPSSPPEVGFPAYNGPETGFIGSDYQSGGSGTGNIDNWLVLPRLNVSIGDSLVFYSGAYNSATYPDSIRVMYSPAGDSVPSAGTWVELGRFFVPSFLPSNIVPWTRKSFGAPAPGPTGRFAIRYCVVNGGLGGSNSSSIGIDAISVVSLLSGIKNLGTGVPESYALSQNYPNPFNPSTNINFALPRSGNVKLAVYDVLGNEVDNVFNGFKAAGNYSVNFDASKLSSGVYFYKLISGDFTQTKKMMLIK